jgi:quinol-cytochrome oxidoreductase complex cytochrome b subunit
MHADGLGRFLQAFHYWGSAVLILHSLGHLVALTWTGGYRRPGALRFLSSIFIFLCAIGFQLTGNILPYDRHGIQTAGIEGGIAARAPGVGGAVAKMLLGEKGLDASTVERWYLLHRIALPVLALVALALWFASRQPGRGKSRWAAAIPLAIVAVLAAVVRSPLGTMATEADFDQFNARVSWYMWPLHGAMRMFERLSAGAGWVGAMLVPGLLFAFLFALVFFGNRVPVKWSRMALLLAAAIFAVGTFGFGSAFAPLTGTRDPAGAVAANTDSAAKIDEALAKKGRETFNALPCADCHGKDGAEAGGGPALTRVWQRHPDADYYVRYIHNPSSVQPNSTMPAFPKLTQPELLALAEFLRSPKKGR